MVYDPETDAAVAADAAAGVDLELDEFADTLDRAGFEDEVHAAEAAAAVEELAPEPAPVDELVEEPPATYLDAVPEGDEFERGLQSLVSDELAPGPVENAPGQLPTEPAAGTLSDLDSVPGAFGVAGVADAPPAVADPASATAEESVVTATEAQVEAPVEAKAEAPAELTAAGLVRRTPKKRSEDATGGGMPMMAARTTGTSQRSPEEVRKMLSRYRSGLNKGRGGADAASTDTPES